MTSADNTEGGVMIITLEQAIIILPGKVTDAPPYALTMN